MIRIAAAILFTAAGAAAGAAFSHRLNEERTICRETAELLRSCALMIRYTGADVYELSAGLKTQSGLESLTFREALPEEYRFGEDFHALWKKALDGQKNLPSEERAVLIRLGELLGTCDSEGQLAAIAVLESEISAIETRRDENCLRKGKLFRSVGVLAGVMTGILVI